MRGGSERGGGGGVLRFSRGGAYFKFWLMGRMLIPRGAYNYLREGASSRIYGVLIFLDFTTIR